LGIDNYAGAQRTLANGAVALATLPTKEAVEEVIHPAVATAAVIVVGILVATAAPVRILDGRFRIDVDHARPQLFRDLRERIRKLLGRRHCQRSRIGGLLSFLALH